MIRITAIYPNAPGSRFDADYYARKHTPFARSLLAPCGLEAIEAVIGERGLDGTPPPFWAVAEMRFTSREAFDAAIEACGTELFADIANYTDVAPVLQISRALAE